MQLKQKNSVPKKAAHLTQKRHKISIGKVQRVTRADSMAENKQLRAQMAHDQAKAFKAKNPESHVQKALPAPVQLEQQKDKLMSSLDLPRKQRKLQDSLLQRVADSGIPFSPVEVGQILSMCALNGCENYKAGSKIMQDLIARDYLPYKSAIRALGRLYEHAFHFKGAKAVMEQLNNLYPQTQYDEVGMPVPKDVLTIPIPDLNELADTPTSPTDLTAMKAYMDEVTSKHTNIAYRYSTQHQFLRQLIKQRKNADAVAELFKLFNRVGIAETATVPTPFEPVKFHAVLEKGGEGSEFKPDFPLYYNVIDNMIINKNWSAAMQALVYIRSFNRILDVTPLREQTSTKQWRDFLDVHTHDAEALEFALNHQMRELVVRRGYKAAMESNAPGSADAKTYNQYARQGQLSYSPLINTTPENLVLLTDRSYEHQNIIKQKGGAENTLAFATVEHLQKKFGIKASVSYGSILSGSTKFAEHFAANPDATQGPAREVSKQVYPADLTVIIPKEELIKYGDEMLLSLPKSYDNFIANIMPDVPVKRTLTARQRFNLANKGADTEFKGKKAIKSPLPPKFTPKEEEIVAEIPQ